MLVTVIDYKSGNLASAARGLALAAEQLGVSADIRITSDPEIVARADKIVLPGQARLPIARPGWRELMAWLRRCSRGLRRGRRSSAFASACS